MGRKRSQARKSGSKHSTGITVNPQPSYGPFYSRTYSQDHLDIKISNEQLYLDECKKRDTRLHEAGFEFYHNVFYKGVSMCVTDIRGDTAYVDYCGNQYQVRLEELVK